MSFVNAHIVAYITDLGLQPVHRRRHIQPHRRMRHSGRAGVGTPLRQAWSQGLPQLLLRPEMRGLRAGAILDGHPLLRHSFIRDSEL